MKTTPWNVPINTSWHRDLDLKEFVFNTTGLVLSVEEESGTWWQIIFKSVQAFKATAEECAGSILSKLPQKGGLFEVLDSQWIGELGDASFLSKSRHYIVCCYDVVIEVISLEAEVSKVQRTSL